MLEWLHFELKFLIMYSPLKDVICAESQCGNDLEWDIPKVRKTSLTHLHFQLQNENLCMHWNWITPNMEYKMHSSVLKLEIELEWSRFDFIVEFRSVYGVELEMVFYQTSFFFVYFGFHHMCIFSSWRTTFLLIMV